jgi:predicted transposase/invertase (TIGR01784 family)
MVYVRLSKFVKTEAECESDLDRMLFTFKNAHNLSKKPASFSKMVFKRLFEIARISNFTDEELMDYESEMKHFSDHANALAYAKKKGRIEGFIETAKNMLATGFSVADIIKATKLSREQVRALKRA